jgi:predicted AlkP superfamily pyrophosphatase or phosphodiesterase
VVVNRDSIAPAGMYNLQKIKTMESYKETIANNLVNENHSLTTAQDRVMSKISEAVNYAWNNWDDKIIQTYYEGEKPAQPTEDFIKQWVENEDFEADGYDIEELQDLFGSN